MGALIKQYHSEVNDSITSPETKLDPNTRVALLILGQYFSAPEDKLPQDIYYFFSQASQSSPQGMFWQGLCLKEGFGIAQDAELAWSCFKVAGELKQLPEAQNYLGICYHKKNPEKAFDLFSKAKDYPRAQRNAGLCLWKGHGTEINLLAAANCLKLAYSSGIEQAKLEFIQVMQQYNQQNTMHNVVHFPNKMSTRTALKPR